MVEKDKATGDVGGTGRVQTLQGQRSFVLRKVGSPLQRGLLQGYDIKFLFSQILVAL